MKVTFLCVFLIVTVNGLLANNTLSPLSNLFKCKNWRVCNNPNKDHNLPYQIKSMHNATNNLQTWNQALIDFLKFFNATSNNFNKKCNLVFLYKVKTPNTMPRESQANTVVRNGREIFIHLFETIIGKLTEHKCTKKDKRLKLEIAIDDFYVGKKVDEREEQERKPNVVVRHDSRRRQADKTLEELKLEIISMTRSPIRKLQGGQAIDLLMSYVKYNEHFINKEKLFEDMMNLLKEQTSDKTKIKILKTIPIEFFDNNEYNTTIYTNSTIIPIIAM